MPHFILVESPSFKLSVTKVHIYCLIFSTTHPPKWKNETALLYSEYTLHNISTSVNVALSYENIMKLWGSSSL